MRTTIDIDDPILKKLKDIQARDGRSLGRLVSDLLAHALASEVREAAPQYFSWISSPGPLLVDICDKEALYEALEDQSPQRSDGSSAMSGGDRQSGAS